MRTQLSLLRSTLLIISCILGFTLEMASPSLGQELKPVIKSTKTGSFWLLSHELSGKKYPPYPFDPYSGKLPVYEIKGFPGKYVVGDSPEDYQQLKASKKSRSLSMSALDSDEMSLLGEGGGEVAYAARVFTNAPETLMFDTMSSSSNGVLPSWRDVRTSPVPNGMAFGILIQTNCPFELTKIEAEVLLENPGNLSDTEFEVGFFRNTNQFRLGMYVDPECVFSDVRETVSKTLTDLGNGHWLLSVELSTYGWGTNRVVTIRTVPNSDGTMTKMSFIACSNTIPGVTAYSSDNTTTNITQVSLPKMRVWRRMVSATRAVSYETLPTDLDLTYLPGYQLGTSTNLLLPWTWETDELHYWRTIVDTREGMKFFLTRPDPTE